MTLAAPATAVTPAVDVVFDAAGTTLPVEYAQPLLAAVAQVLPWMTDAGGVHALRTAPTGYGQVLLPARAKLRLRVPEARAEDALRLAHQRLAVADQEVRIGAGTMRPLLPAATLAAQKVASDAADTAAFEREVAAALAALGIDARFIAGGTRRAVLPGRTVSGHALTVHGLRPDESLRLQAAGLGGDRALGWGLFLPAKLIAGIDP